MYQRKGTGSGGTLTSPKKDSTPLQFPDENVCPKEGFKNRKIEFSAFVERPNPPNTEFRRDLPVLYRFKSIMAEFTIVSHGKLQ